MKSILQLFEDTFEDHQLSDEEKKFLSRVLGDQNLVANDIGYLRNRIFEFAREALNEATPMDVLNWVEKVNKILLIHDRRLAIPDDKPKAYFTPRGDCCFEIRGFIQRTYKTLDICVFTISDDLIAKDILFAIKKGVKIRLITDNDKVHDEGSDIKSFHEAGIPVKTDFTSSHMHHKFAISDQKVLLTGSYNWTKSAATLNHENILITRHKDLIASYQEEFDKLWEELIDFEG